MYAGHLRVKSRARTTQVSRKRCFPLMLRPVDLLWHLDPGALARVASYHHSGIPVSGNREENHGQEFEAHRLELR